MDAESLSSTEIDMLRLWLTSYPQQAYSWFIEEYGRGKGDELFKRMHQHIMKSVITRALNREGTLKGNVEKIARIEEMQSYLIGSKARVTWQDDDTVIEKIEKCVPFETNRKLGIVEKTCNFQCIHELEVISNILDIEATALRTMADGGGVCELKFTKKMKVSPKVSP